MIEKRYATFLKVLERGGSFLRGQLKTRDSVTDEGMMKLKMDILSDTSDLEAAPVPSTKRYCNYVHNPNYYHEPRGYRNPA